MQAATSPARAPIAANRFPSAAAEPRSEPARLAPQLTVVVPVYNEAGNVGPLVAEIERTLTGRMRYEIVVIDDGSTDGTLDELADLEQHDDLVRVIRHGHNRGQSAAIHTGVQAAAAPVVAVLDGDGQNDPADLPSMFGKLTCAERVRMVVGERRNRNDTFVRRLTSRVANFVRSHTLKDNIRDTGCGLKVFYRADFMRLPAFDHMHRFLPALLQRDGGKVCSTPVNHRPRVRGHSKYGINNRLWTGIVDLIGVLWLTKRGFK